MTRVTVVAMAVFDGDVDAVLVLATDGLWSTVSTQCAALIVNNAFDEFTERGVGADVTNSHARPKVRFDPQVNDPTAILAMWISVDGCVDECMPLSKATGGLRSRQRSW